MTKATIRSMMSSFFLMAETDAGEALDYFVSVLLPAMPVGMTVRIYNLLGSEPNEVELPIYRMLRNRFPEALEKTRNPWGESVFVVRPSSAKWVASNPEQAEAAGRIAATLARI